MFQCFNVSMHVPCSDAGDVFRLVNDFRFAPPLPPGQDRFGLFPTPGREGPDLSCGLPGRGGWLQVELNR